MLVFGGRQCAGWTVLIATILPHYFLSWSDGYPLAYGQFAVHGGCVILVLFLAESIANRSSFSIKVLQIVCPWFCVLKRRQLSCPTLPLQDMTLFVLCSGDNIDSSLKSKTFHFVWVKKSRLMYWIKLSNGITFIYDADHLYVLRQIYSLKKSPGCVLLKGISWSRRYIELTTCGLVYSSLWTIHVFISLDNLILLQMWWVTSRVR